jgi:hypothetical protein
MDYTNSDTGVSGPGALMRGPAVGWAEASAAATPDNGGFDFVAQPAGGWIIEATGQIRRGGRPLS